LSTVKKKFFFENFVYFFLSYAGPLTIIVQEIDGHFVHTVQVDAAVSKHDIQCHSKGRKLKRKKVILGTGEEVEMDLSQMDADSPILWIRFFCFTSLY
jgi:transcription initiation factor TFIID subunit 2